MLVTWWSTIARFWEALKKASRLTAQKGGLNVQKSAVRLVNAVFIRLRIKACRSRTMKYQIASMAAFLCTGGKREAMVASFRATGFQLSELVTAVPASGETASIFSGQPT